MMSTDAIDDTSPVAIDDSAYSLFLVFPVLDGALRLCDFSIVGVSLLSLLLLVLVVLVVVLVVGSVADHNVLVDVGSIIVL